MVGGYHGVVATTKAEIRRGLFAVSLQVNGSNLKLYVLLSEI